MQIYNGNNAPVATGGLVVSILSRHGASVHIWVMAFPVSMLIMKEMSFEPSCVWCVKI
jgi:hypothetical protein